METGRGGPSKEEQEWEEPKEEEIKPPDETDLSSVKADESKVISEQREAAVRYYENRINELKKAAEEYRKAESVFNLQLPEEDFGFSVVKEGGKGGWLAERSARKTLQAFEKKYGSLREVRERITKLENELQQHK